MAKRRAPRDMGTEDIDQPTVFAVNDQPVSPSELQTRVQATKRRIGAHRLRAHELQPSDRHADGEVHGLAESIRALGLLQPPLVMKADDGDYVIIAGHRRVRAWQLLAYEGEVDQGIDCFVVENVSRERSYQLMAAEAFHRKEHSVLHKARITGTNMEVLRQELGREPSTRELAAVLPQGRDAISRDLKIWRGMNDEELGPLVRGADTDSKSLLYDILNIEDERRKREALQALNERGATAARKVLRGGQTGPPVVERKQRKDEDDWDLILRVRPNTPEKELNAALKELDQARHDLKVRLGLCGTSERRR